MNLIIRQYTDKDAPYLVDLFRKTVHTVCARDYSPEQLNAWAPVEIDIDRFSTRLKNSFTLVALEDESFAGFASLLADGCVDMFYVSADSQGSGVGSMLMNAIEIEARSKGLKFLFSDVSLSAREFFTRKGFRIEREYTKTVSETEFRNAIMRKDLP